MITGVPGKTGIVYTLDLKTGEFLWARPTVMQNVVQKIDGATGKVTVNPDTIFSKAGETKFVCPTPNGGKVPSRSLQPAHKYHVLRPAEHLRGRHVHRQSIRLRRQRPSAHLPRHA